MSKKYAYILVLILVVLIAAGCFPAGQDSGNQIITKPAAATAFVLKDMQDKDVNFPADFSGQKVALVFFSNT